MTCRTLLDEKEIKGELCCPICGYEGLSMLTEYDVNININCFELRLLCVWAESIVLNMKDKNSKSAFYSVINAIKNQLPENFEITMFDEPQETPLDITAPVGTLLN